MEKWLLFDGIALHAGNISPRNVERAAAIEADLAHAGLPVGNRAAMSAGVAADAIAIQLFPESGVGFANVRVGCEDVMQRGHNCILRLRDCTRLVYPDRLFKPESDGEAEENEAQFADFIC